MDDGLDESLWISYQIVEDENKELRKIIRGLMSHLEEHSDNKICKGIKKQCEESHVYNHYYLHDRDYEEN
jgi:hypothetical protein